MNLLLNVPLHDLYHLEECEWPQPATATPWRAQVALLQCPLVILCAPPIHEQETF